MECYKTASEINVQYMYVNRIVINR